MTSGLEPYPRFLDGPSLAAILLAALAVVLLVATVGLGYLTPAVFPPLLAVIGLLALANLAYMGPARRWCSVGCLLALQLHVDVVGLTVALHLSGGIENPLYLLPVVLIVLSGVVLSRRQCFGVALNAGLLCAVMVWAEWAHLLPHFTLLVVPHGPFEEVHEAYDAPYVAARTVLQLAVLLLTAQFVSRLAEQSRAHERALLEAAEESRSGRELLEESLEGTGTALRLLDRSLVSLWTNAQWRRWFCEGSPAEAWISAWTSAEGSPARQTLADGTAHQAEASFSEQAASPGAGGRTFAITTAALHDREGRTARLAEMIRDVTAEKRAEAAILKAGKLATVGELAGRLAHEVNNPVAIIITKARLLLSDRRAEMSDKVARDLERIVDLGDRVAGIARGLLAYGRPFAAPRSPIDLRSPARRALAFIGEQARRQGVGVVDDLGDEPLVVEGSAVEIEQVFLNLILNALDAMPKGGTLRLVGEQTRRGDGEAEVAVAVVDDGSGIPQEDRERVFEPFFTTKPEGKGSGLGLSVCDGLVRAHGGSLEVDGEPGSGTRMVVRLPAAGGAEREVERG